MVKPSFRLRLKGETLTIRRINKEGGFGKRHAWRIGKRSNVPKALYHLIHSFIRKRVGQCEDTEFPSVKEAVLRALCEAAEACGCTHRFGSESGDVTWFLDGAALFAFQIHKDFLRKVRARELRSSAAPLRWILKVQERGFVKYLPRRTSLDSS